jgi:dTDP-4-amino-4,6-dideoxygalactose transaminase
MIKVAQGCLEEEELAEVKSVWDYGYYGLSYKVNEFEEKLKGYLGAKNVVAVNTGTSALHLALDAIGISKGDEVIVPSLTFVASFQAISATGAKPVACDVYPDTLLMNMEDMQRKITRKTKAIMPVHYCGNPCNMDSLTKIWKQSGIRIVEDAAHALGGTYNSNKIGSFGDVTCFSFDSIKNMTCGEGGAIVTTDDKLAEICREKRLLGIKRETVKSSEWQDQWKQRTWAFSVSTQGFRYHMGQINAAIGVAQLKKLDSFIARRREICRRYNEAFIGLENIQTLKVNYDEVAPHIYVIRVKGFRDELKEFLQSREIETAINYIPNHLHPMYNDGSKLPETDKAYEEILSLPLHCKMSNEDVEAVVSGVIEGVQRCQQSVS